MTFSQPPSNVITMPGVPAPFVPPVQIRITPITASQVQLTVASGPCVLAPANPILFFDAQGLATFTGTVQAATLPVTCTIRVHNMTATGVMDIISNPFDVVPPVPPGVFVQNVIGGGIIP